PFLGRVPDLARVRFPGESLRGVIDVRKRPLLTRQIDDRHGPSVVAENGMVDERDKIASRRYARMADPSGRSVESLADRELQAVLGTDVSHDGEALPVRAPVGALHVVPDDTSRRARQ